MSKTWETFFTSIGCMDGRVQDAVANFGRQKFGAKFADTITEAGLVGQLSKELVDDKLLKSLKKKINISLQKHHSKGIIVHGHQDCAGNPVEDEKHKDDVGKSVNVIRSLINTSVPIIGVFIIRDGENWQAQEIPILLLR